MTRRTLIYYGALVVLFLLVGSLQSWSVALTILNLCLISAVMALGLNIQWGYGGLFNAGVMGFVAVGGVTALIVSHPPVQGAIQAGGLGILLSLVILAATCIAIVAALRFIRHPVRLLIAPSLALIGFILLAPVFMSATSAIEAFEPASSGFLGGFGLPIIISWPLAAAAAAGFAFLIGRVALGLRADYLAVATLGISEIIVSFVKNEDWLTRGVKNATGLPRTVPSFDYLKEQQLVRELAEWTNSDRLQSLQGSDRLAALDIYAAEMSSIIMKLCHAGLFVAVLIGIATLCSLALNSPWGRMIRAIRDNEMAAEAMGKNVRGRHMEILVLGSAVMGIAGAMLVTYEGQLTPTSYHPLRFTFLIWVMVIVGGSGNNAGAIFGAFVIWLIYIQSEFFGFWLVDSATLWMEDSSAIRTQLLHQAQYFRPLILGIILLIILRFNPSGLMPEQPQRKLHNLGQQQGERNDPEISSNASRYGITDIARSGR